MVAKILIVEDNPITRKLTSIALRSDEFSVTEADTGRAAVDALRAIVPDLVLQDLFLPDMDGYELFKRLRSARSERFPIVAFTGMSDERRILSLGFSEVFLKPISPSDLFTRVRSLLERNKRKPRDEPRRLLVFDRDVARMEPLRLGLERCGHSVVLTGNAREALQQVVDGVAEAVVCDVDSAEGRQLGRALLADPRFNDVPMVFARTGNVSEFERNLAIRAGASAIIRHGQDPSRTINAIAVALESARSAPPRLRRLRASRSPRREPGMVRREQALSAIASLTTAVAESAADGRNAPSSLVSRALACFLDAGGFSRGAAYAVRGGGSLCLYSRLGYPENSRVELETFWSQEELLERARSTLEALEFSSECSEHRALLRRASVNSMLVLPLTLRGVLQGIVVAGSQDATLPAWSREIATRAEPQLAQVLRAASVKAPPIEETMLEHCDSQASLSTDGAYP